MKCKLVLSLSIILILILLIYAIAIEKNINSEATVQFRAAKNPLTIEDFKIGDMILGMNIKEIEKILGKPKKTYIWKRNEGEYYEYSDLIIGYSLVTGRVLSFSIKKKELQTYRGISVGDKEEDVIKRYGEGYRLGNILNYWLNIRENYEDLTYNIDFTIVDGVVSQIKIYFGGD